MKRSMSNSSDNSSRFGRWDADDSNRPHKKPKTDRVIEEDDADSSAKTSPFHEQSIRGDNIPESELWVVTRFLGKGSYGSVHLAVNTIEGEENSLPSEMVIKTCDFPQKSRLGNERKFLLRLKDNPYVVSYYFSVMTTDRNTEKILYNTILEYCPGECLAKALESHRGRGLPEEDVKRFATQILIGLKYTHEKEIIHCDIKPKNIFLAADSTAKISGFGKAMRKGSVEYGEGWGHRRGTARFMSPELMGDMVLDYGADVWAYGCTVLEMLTGEMVWGEEGELDWEDWIALIGDSGAVPHVPDYLSAEAKDFLSKCLQRDPDQRWTVDSLLKHPFVYEEEEVRYEEENQIQEENEIGDANVEAYLEEEEEEIGVADNVAAHEPYLEEEEGEEIYDPYSEEQEIGVADNVEAHEPYLEEEEEEIYDPYLEEEEEEIGVAANVEAHEPYLEEEEEEEYDPYSEEEEEEEEGQRAIVIDEEYPKEDWEEDL